MNGEDKKDFYTWRNKQPSRLTDLDNLGQITGSVCDWLKGGELKRFDWLILTGSIFIRWVILWCHVVDKPSAVSSTHFWAVHGFCPWRKVKWHRTSLLKFVLAYKMPFAKRKYRSYLTDTNVHVPDCSLRRHLNESARGTVADNSGVAEGDDFCF